MFFKKSSILNHYYKKTEEETLIIPCCNPKIRLLPGLCPGPRWGSLRPSLRPPSRLGRATLPRPLPLGVFGALTSKKRLQRLYNKFQVSAPPLIFFILEPLLLLL